MSSPFTHHDMGSPHPMSAPQGFDDGDSSDADIPKRMMRVKVLYTFDDENKTNCLARLPNALPIPVIPLDESTQIGVVELKICIQAIVASSPELIAKLEHDYTVYAYDYSEYETPIVGQGMLSWVLATASPTPTAPASQSKTMITGRVCKNILGLFSSNGVKETLEVKLKLVPVPSCSKGEFLQNMATYRNPNVVMPEGFDNTAWNSFLQAIPNAGSLQEQANTGNGRAGMGGMEQLHDMLTPNFGPDEDNYSVQHSRHGSRNGSPTPSHLSNGNQQHQGYSQSRPASRMSTQHQTEYAIDEQGFEDGPAKKRARLTQADWNGRGSFGGSADTLRGAVITSASLRGFRPSAVGNSSAGNDMIPRAPTPRPSEKRHGQSSRPALSNLRRASTNNTYTTPYPPSDSGFSRMDSGIYSLGDDEASDRYGSPSPDLPSSPPEFIPVDPPSSPALPELPYLGDSGFQSEINMEPPPAEKAPTVYGKHLKRQQEGRIEWQQVQPGPQQNLPRQSFPHFDPVSQKNAQSSLQRRKVASGTGSPQQAAHLRGGRAYSRVAPAPSSGQTTAIPAPHDSPSPSNIIPTIEGQQFEQPPCGSNRILNDVQYAAPAQNAGQPPPQKNAQPKDTTAPRTSFPPQFTQSAQPAHKNREPSQGPITTGVVLPPKQKPNSKQGQAPNRGQHAPALPRSQTWTGANSSDVDSDGPGGDSRAKSRYRGSGLTRSKSINTQLEESVAAGLPVKHCRNCGEIKTPTWRPYWTRAHEGNADHLEPVRAEEGIHMIEITSKDDNGETTAYRVYKQYSHLTNLEREKRLYEQYIFCNPCGDWIRKHSEFRPQECWDGSTKKLIKKRRSRQPKSRMATEYTSDFPIPSSEWDLQGPGSTQYGGPPPFTDPWLPSEGATHMPPPSQQPQAPDQQSMTKNAQMEQRHQQRIIADNTDDPWAEISAVAALQHAIQASPARVLGSKASPVEVCDDLSPKRTNRLLFPSPRKAGEFKSLHDDLGPKSATTSPTPLGTASSNSLNGQPTPVAQNDQDFDAVDKENLPPLDDNDDDFADLFDNSLLPETPGKIMTPATQRSIANLLKTPTPLKSISRVMTPRTGSKRSGDHLVSPTLSRRRTTSRTSHPTSSEERTDGLKTMTPFTASLNQFLSDDFRSSPSKAFNWAINSSPKSGFGDGWAINNDDVFISGTTDFPGLPSSPPMLSGTFGGGGDLGFELFEDATATEGLSSVWEGGFFDSDLVDDMQGQGGEVDGSEKSGEKSDTAAGKRKRDSNGSGIDFARILEQGPTEPIATAAASGVAT